MNKRTGVDSSFAIVAIVVIVSFISGLVFGLIIGMKARPNYSENISIPSSSMIDQFCEDMGFKYGWLSSTSCTGINQVQCYRSVGDLDQYKCIEWTNKTD